MEEPYTKASDQNSDPDLPSILETPPKALKDAEANMAEEFEVSTSPTLIDEAQDQTNQ